MNLKRGLVGITGIVSLILGVTGFLMSIDDPALGETFGDLIVSIVIIGWFMFSIIALFFMMIETKNRLCAQIASSLWLIVFTACGITAAITPHDQIALSSSQMFCASLLVFVMPAIVAEDARQGWD